jgi:hypothetical protein
MSTRMFSRAEFLKSALGLTTAAVGGSLLAPAVAQAAPATAEPSPPPTPVTTHYSNYLTLDGGLVGTVGDTRGGNAYLPMLDGDGKPQLGTTQYRSLDVPVQLDLGQDFFNLVAGAWAGQGRQLNGSIFRVGPEGGVVIERQFKNAAIVGTTFPTLNVRSSEMGFLTVSLLPGSSTVRTMKELPFTNLVRRSAKQRWNVSNFTLDIDGLDTPVAPGLNNPDTTVAPGVTNPFSHGVSQIDSFTIASSLPYKTPVSPNLVRVPGRVQLSFPTVTVTLERRAGGPLTEWFEASVVKGDPKAMMGTPTGRNGVLSLLAEDAKTVLARVRLTDVGVCELSDGPLGTVEDLVTAVLYCGRMDLEAPKPPKV